MEEPNMRGALNSIIENAINHYNRGEHVEFFIALSKSYSKSDPNKRLIKFVRGCEVNIIPENSKNLNYSDHTPIVVYNKADFTITELIIKRDKILKLNTKELCKVVIKDDLLYDIRLITMDDYLRCIQGIKNMKLEEIAVAKDNAQFKIIFHKEDNTTGVFGIEIENSMVLNLNFDGEILVRNKKSNRFSKLIYDIVARQRGCIYSKEKKVTLNWDHPITQRIVSAKGYVIEPRAALSIPLGDPSSSPSGGIISELLARGFRADGIAYLLNIIGETLMNRGIKMTGIMGQSSLDQISIQIFEAIISSSELTMSASSLDQSVQNSRKKVTGWHLTDNIISRFRQGLNSRVYDIPSSYFKDANQAPFTNRLEEMRNIAKMNLAIAHIVQGGKDNLSLASQCVKDINESINKHHQYFTVSAERLQVLQDFLFALGVTDFEESEVVEKTSEIVPTLTFIAENDHKNLKGLSEKLKTAMDPMGSLEIRNSIARYYCDQAKKVEKINHIHGLLFWKKALEQYTTILEKRGYDLSASLGYVECQLQMSKFKKSEAFLKKREIHLKSSPEYLTLRTKSLRKQGDYVRAHDLVHEALKNNPNNQKAKKELRIIERLKSPIEEYTAHYHDTQVAIESNFLTAGKQDKAFYDILSIDGGGIRGVIPAVWLSEIEKRAHRPIAHLFHLIAGTSTGGIIAAGLSMPDELDYKPRYRAYELLDLYKTKSAEIFTPWSGMNQFFNSIPVFGQAFGREKYSNHGRSALFNAYFCDAKLSTAITELVIPAVDENDLQQTYLFTRHKARKNPDHNYRLFDAAMATSSAPTYFPVYKIGSSSFIDGGISANNPADLACSEAIGQGIKECNINLLSLGTGDCVSDPLNAGESRSGLWWASNLHRPALNPQAGNVDGALHNRLQDRYQRWQCWFEDDSIGLDKHEPKTIRRLEEMAREYIIEMDESDENPINRTVERLLRNR